MKKLITLHQCLKILSKNSKDIISNKKIDLLYPYIYCKSKDLIVYWEDPYLPDPYTNPLRHVYPVVIKGYISLKHGNSIAFPPNTKDFYLLTLEEISNYFIEKMDIPKLIKTYKIKIKL